MDRVCQQRHRSTDHHDDKLKNGGHQQDHETDLQRPDPFFACLHSVVDRVGRVVRVRHEQAVEEALHSGRVRVPSVTVILMVMVMVMVMVVVVVVTLVMLLVLLVLLVLLERVVVWRAHCVSCSSWWW